MKRSFLLAAFMLLSITVLVLTDNRAVTAVAPAAPEFCTTCADSCWNEANSIYDECRWDNSGNVKNSQFFCDNEVIRYYNNCVSSFCNYAGCSIPPKQPRLCRSLLDQCL